MKRINIVYRILCVLLLIGLAVGVSPGVQTALAQAEPPTLPSGKNPADPAALGDPDGDAAPLAPVEYTATFTVNGTADLPDAAPGNGVCAASNNVCSLRASIEESNSLAGAQLINLAASVYVVSTELKVTGETTIVGAGRGQTIVDGNNATRVFHIALGAGANFISDLTIRNGNNSFTTEPAGDGGAIFNNATLTVTNVHVDNNRAYSGGGIFNQYWFGNNVPALYLNDVLITNNQSTTVHNTTGGGGLFNGSKLVGDGVEIANNSATQAGGGFFNNSFHPDMILRNFYIHDNSATYGAGVENDLTRHELGYALLLENGIIKNNTVNCCSSVGSSTGGGGIYNNDGIMTLHNVAIVDNVAPAATNPAAYGGALVNIMHMNLIDVSITGNKATYGAAIFNGNYDGKPNQLTMTNVTISGNVGDSASTTTTEGGAVFNVQHGRIRSVNTTITANFAEITGGIENRHTNGVIELVNTILASNTDAIGSPDCYGAISSLGYNLIGDPSGNRHFRCNFSSKSSDQLNKAAQVGALLEGPRLTDFPGVALLRYHPVTPPSTAINRSGNADCPVTDTIGNLRPFGGVCDIGAFEYNAWSNATNWIFLPIAHR